MIRLPTAALAALLLALGAAGCRSPEGWRKQADDEVYELVRRRRAKLDIGDGSFTIEPSEGSLRQRILRGEAAQMPPLTLVQCLEIAAENSRDYQTRKEALYLIALDLTLERWQFSVKETGVFTATDERFEDGTETATGDARLGLSKVLGTGARIAGDIGLKLSRSLTSSDDWNLVSDLGLAITQPLLRGAGRRIVMEPLTQAERDLVYEVRLFERFRRTFAFDVATRFYDLLQVQDSVLNQETNYENLQKLSQRNAALAEAGRLSDIEAGQARQNELRSLDALLQARARLDSQKDDFKLFLGLPPQLELSFDAGELARLADQDLSPIEIDEESASKLALTSRLDHQTALDQVEDSERQVFVAADALRAGLNIAAAWRNSSSPDEPAHMDFEDSTWKITAVLDLPLDRLPERNAYRLALISSEASRRRAELSEDSIRADLREDLRDIVTRLESWEIQKSAVDLAVRRIESIDLKLQAGRADTRDLLEAQASLLEAQNAASSALVDYTLSRLGLFLDMELLQVDPAGLHVEDPLAVEARADSGDTLDEPEKPGA